MGLGHRHMGNSQQRNQPGPFNAPPQHAYDLARADDLRLLQAWEQGLLPVLGATVRARQIRRALALPEAGTPKP